MSERAALKRLADLLRAHLWLSAAPWPHGASAPWPDRLAAQPTDRLTVDLVVTLIDSAVEDGLYFEDQRRALAYTILAALRAEGETE